MIYLDQPDLGVKERELVAACMNSCEVSTRGPVVGRFEKACAEYLGVEDCVAVNCHNVCSYGKRCAICWGQGPLCGCG